MRGRNITAIDDLSFLRELLELTVLLLQNWGNQRQFIITSEDASTLNT